MRLYKRFGDAELATIFTLPNPAPVQLSINSYLVASVTSQGWPFNTRKDISK